MRKHFTRMERAGMRAMHVRAHKHEKPTVPFMNIDMGVPVQSCYKGYCLLRSNFIRLKHTPKGEHWGCYRGLSLLVSMLGLLWGSVLWDLPKNHCYLKCAPSDTYCKLSSCLVSRIMLWHVLQPNLFKCRSWIISSTHMWKQPITLLMAPLQIKYRFLIWKAHYINRNGNTKKDSEPLHKSFNWISSARGWRFLFLIESIAGVVICMHRSGSCPG